MRIGVRGRRRRRHRISCTTDNHPNTDRYKFHNIRNNIGYNVRNIKNVRFKCLTIIASSAIFALITPIAGSSLHFAWRSSSHSSLGRNIRHLPCVSRRTGETGLCMFAYSCAKANGTHLGTCIDRFYFGSCCKISAGNSDPDLLEPIVHNYLTNKDDSSSTKIPYQKPSFVPDLSTIFGAGAGSSSSTFLPHHSISTMTKPVSMVTSSSNNNFYTASSLVKTSSSKPTTAIHTISSLLYDTTPVTSRIPIVNFTLSQALTSSGPSASYVTTSSPLVYSTTLATVLQTNTHKLVPAVATTGYSKPSPVKPSSKPNSKPKPSSQGKPGLSKPKPTKIPYKPSTHSSYAPSIHTVTVSSIGNYLNKTTLHASYTNNYGPTSKPTLATETSVPVKVTFKPTTIGLPTPITLFTSSKRPPKPTKPSTYTPTTTNYPSTSFVKVPITTVVGHNKISSSTSSHSNKPENFGTFEPYSRINGTSTETTAPSERPSPWGSTGSNSWHSSSSGTTASSHPGLVTWTTIEEASAMIVPDRTKPTNIIKPSVTSPITKPTFVFTKPTVTERPFTKPAFSKPDINENQRPLSTMSRPSNPSTTGAATSPSWIEVSVTTHAPTASHTSESSEDITVNLITHSTSKPSTSITVPVSSPLPIDSTSSSLLETNELESIAINMSNYKEVCGRRLFPSARIVGGEKAAFGRWPWQISLRQWRTSTYLHKCGAALFNENWAVTAAHCVENVPPSDLLLRLGEHDLSMEDEPYGYQERRVQIVASHPQFDPRTFEYDLALLRFYEPVKFQPNIIPVCVPEDDTNFVSSQAYVTGWGRLYEDGPLPSVLQEVSVPVINNSVCENMYQAAGYIEHIPNIFICAGWRKGGFDSCEGDSGGPMVIQRPDKRWLLAGIISWGIGCAEPNQPGVYTRISEFRDWINQILQF